MEQDEETELTVGVELTDGVGTSLGGLGHVKPRFSTIEHLRFEEAISTKNPYEIHKGKLKLPNGLELSLGEIMALAGDFYGVPDQPIIDPTGKDNTTFSRRQRFMAAYATLAHADYETTKIEVEKLLNVVRKEKLMKEYRDIELKTKNVDCTDGGASDKASSEESLTEEWDTITGGLWVAGVPVVFGRIMKLAECNYDHFLPYAKDAYLVGHELAIEKAKEASRAPEADKKDLLEEAYSIDAFACHFLTDCFATGHARTPRHHLEKCVTSSKIGLLLIRYMHDEDNKYGIRVTNKRGDKWVAYGDGMLLSNKGKEHYTMTVEAVQTSVDEVFEAFQSPEKATGMTRAADLVPFVDHTQMNNFAMFRVEDGKVLRRRDLENLSDPTTKSNWTGLGTLMKLVKYEPSQSVID